MGKRGRVKRHQRADTIRGSKKRSAEFEENRDIDPHAEGFFRDEVDEFHSQKEKILLERSDYLEPASSTDEEGEEEVLGLQLSDRESREEEEEEGEEEEGEEFQLPPDLRRYYASDDDEEEEEEGQPPELSDRAWGHSHKTFYNTDYVDDELRGSEEDEEAELEEREARALQQRMAAALDEQDFELPEIVEAEVGGEITAGEEEQVIQDLSKLSREEKLTLLENDAPEMFELMEEFQDKFSVAMDTLHPLVEAARRDNYRELFTSESYKLPKSMSEIINVWGAKYLEVKFHLYLCYCLNIMFYLRLKACKTPVQNHPVIGRIVQIRQLIGQLESLDKKIDPKLKTALKIISDKRPNPASSLPTPDSITKQEKEKHSKKRKHSQASRGSKKPKKLSQVLESDEGTDISAERVQGEESAEPQERNKKLTSDPPGKESPMEYYERIKAEKAAQRKAKREARKARIDEGREEEEEEEEEEEVGKRAITYQIARNKGLTPKRKKEQRNPRVRHRNKYRKVLIKRKSQVLPVVTEMQRYGGERTGIRANLTRSIKIN